ncbi:hypothetical protein E4U40_000350 [Claviceps sp. LM458 group G5]|nr:hypothetical protein E4U40_000350 [Claviceps sp. LM458 group G5]
MKVISALLVVVAASVASAFDDDGDNWVPPPGYKPYPEGRWCNHGTAGNKGCEEQNEHTYCLLLLRRTTNKAPTVRTVALSGAPLKRNFGPQ